MDNEKRPHIDVVMRPPATSSRGGEIVTPHTPTTKFKKFGKQGLFYYLRSKAPCTLKKGALPLGLTPNPSLFPYGSWASAGSSIPSSKVLYFSESTLSERIP